MRRRRFDDIFDMMRREMESLFDDFEDDFLVANASDPKYIGGGTGEGSESRPLASASYRKPVADFWETDNEVVATFELPGVDKKDIETNVDDNTLEVKVEKRDDDRHEDKEKGVVSKTSSYTGFYRRIPLPDGVDSEKTDATYNNGVLEVRIPKKEEKKKNRKKIDVK